MFADFWQSIDFEPAVRGIAALVACLLVGLAGGQNAIRWLQARFREPIKSISPTVMRLHQHKAQTPTMGGLFIVAGVVCGTLVFGHVGDPLVCIALAAMTGFAAVGFVDDLTKLRTSRRGISGLSKLSGQFLVAVPISLVVGWLQKDLSAFALTRNVLILVVAANAVNLTDGLDGLAGGCGLIASAAIAAMLLVTREFELGIVGCTMAGTLAAFLVFNRFPARVFMGDTGSQAIGALLGYFAIAGGGNWSFALVGGVFLIEAASVILQLASYRIRKKRLFLCAPLHHHFQFAGWSEPKIVRHFWIAALTFAGIGLTFASLQLPTTLASRISPTAGNLSATSRVKDMHADRVWLFGQSRLAATEIHEEICLELESN